MDVSKLKTDTDCKTAERELLAQRQRIIEESTARKLEVIDDNLRRVRHVREDINRQISRARSASTASKRENELWTEMRRAQDRIQHLKADCRTLLPSQIRLDAVAAGEAELASQKKELDELQKPYKGKDHWQLPNTLRRQIAEHEAAEKNWQLKGRRVCEIGEEIAQLQEEYKAMDAERNQLREDRENAAVMASGLV